MKAQIDSCFYQIRTFSVESIEKFDFDKLKIKKVIFHLSLCTTYSRSKSLKWIYRYRTKIIGIKVRKISMELIFIPFIYAQCVKLTFPPRISETLLSPLFSPY